MFLFHHFKDHKYVMLPEQKEFNDILPQLFRTFKIIHVPVNCAEFKCEMPQNYSQMVLYVSYSIYLKAA